MQCLFEVIHCISALQFFKSLLQPSKGYITMIGACSVTKLTEILALLSLFKNDHLKFLFFENKKEHVVSYQLCFDKMFHLNSVPCRSITKTSLTITCQTHKCFVFCFTVISSSVTLLSPIIAICRSVTVTSFHRFYAVVIHSSVTRGGEPVTLVVI